jgi:TolB-like protein/Tfp pilus assembly protein PilF
MSRRALADRSVEVKLFFSEATIKRAEGGEAIYANTAGGLARLLGRPLVELLANGAGEDAAEAQKPTIAVSAFRTSEGAETLAEGLTEDLITRLGRWWFPIIARTSTITGTDTEPRTVGRELNARYVVEGNVRREGTELRVTAQLVDTQSGLAVARHAYVRQFRAVFALQNELTTAIVGDLGPALLDLEAKGLERREPEDLDAWQQALLGAWHFYRRTAEDNARARVLLSEALRRDGHMPLAWYSLALTHQQDIINQWATSPRDSLTGLAEICSEFERRYPTEAWSHVVSAYLDVYQGRRDAAMSRLREAIEIDPNACAAYGLYGQTLAMAREPDQGLEQFELALRLSPKDRERWSIYTGIALAHFVAERYEETIATAKEAARIRPNVAFAYGAMASAQAHLGNLGEARTALETMLRIEPKTTQSGIVSVLGSTEKDIGARYLAGLRLAGLPG